MTRFLAELRRRNAFRVAAAYLVVGWVLIQLVSMIAEPLGLPDWADTLVIVLIGTAFPIALILAWAFEVTPEGVKLTAAVPEDQSIAGKTARRLDYVITGGIVLLIGAIVWQQVARPQAATAPELAARAEAGEGASVAVLPFADMSPDSDQAYFADGISEEVLNVLVRIPGLQVAGRTSSFSYRGQDQDLRIIGDALDVSHVLEGSVRRSGTRLRITAQLIRSADGFHIWSETYDREIADIFDIQDDIAGAVADELATSLGLDTGAVSVARTSDLDAYESFLHARQLYRDRGQANLELAASMLTETLARDPEYGPGWTLLAGVYGVMPYWREAANPLAPELAESWQALSVAAARRAIAINPTDGKAHAFLGVAHANNWNWIEGLDILDRAVSLAPNDPDVLDAAAQILLQAGYGAEAQALAERAVGLDPLVALYRNNYATTFRVLGRLQDAIAQFRAAIQIDPSQDYIYTNLIFSIAESGDLAGTQAVAAAYVAAGRPMNDPELLTRFIAAGSLEEIEPLAAQDQRFLALLYYVLAGEREAYIAANATARAVTSGDVYPFLGPWRRTAYSDPRWKAFVRRTGLVDLWRARGFPPQCRPVGADDFACDWPGE